MKKLIKKILLGVAGLFVILTCVSGILLNSVDNKISGNEYSIEMTSEGNLEPLYATFEIDDSFNGVFQVSYGGQVETYIYALELVNGKYVYAKTVSYGLQYMGKINAYEFNTTFALATSQMINLKMTCNTNVSNRTVANCFLYISLAISLGLIGYLLYEPVRNVVCKFKKSNEVEAKEEVVEAQEE